MLLTLLKKAKFNFMAEKVSLPLKTKIAAWWMIVIGLVPALIFMPSFLLLLNALGFIRNRGVECMGDYALFCEPILPLPLVLLIFFPSLLGVVFLFLPGVFLLVLEKKRRIWKISLILQTLWIIILAMLLFSLCQTKEIIREGQKEIMKPLFSPFSCSRFAISVFVVSLVPLILLFLDRKNFQRAAT